MELINDNGKRVFIYYTIVFFLISFSCVLSQNSNSNLIIGDPDLDKLPFKPGNGISINTFPDTSSFLNDVFPIDDRGFVEFPIIGKVKVTILTNEDLTALLKEKFKAWLRNPNIYLKPVVRVSLLGGFFRPGLYYVDEQSSLWDVVRNAGGPMLDNGIYEMEWKREGDDCDGDLVKIFEQGTSLKKMGFRSGDQIFTPMPDQRTIWDTIADVMPILTFATTVIVMYQTYQRDQLLFQM